MAPLHLACFQEKGEENKFVILTFLLNNLVEHPSACQTLSSDLVQFVQQS